MLRFAKPSPGLCHYPLSMPSNSLLASRKVDGLSQLVYTGLVGGSPRVYSSDALSQEHAVLCTSAQLILGMG